MIYDRATYRLLLKGGCLFFVISLLQNKSLSAQDRPNLMVEAIQISGQITVDGIMDESKWDLAPVITGFRQVEPNQDEPAKYDTEVQVLYNEDYIYIGAFNRDDAGEMPRIADFSRDFDDSVNDYFGIVIDSFNNERDGIGFQVSPFGNLRDVQVFDDFVTNENFDVVWKSKTSIHEDGWSVEIAIPWNSIRFDENQDTWGINFYRAHRRSNEISAWMPWPRAYSQYRMSYAGKIKNIQPPLSPLNLRVQPYSLVQADNEAGATRSDVVVKAGGEIKWSPSQSSILDITFNTDFAQADVDRQVINLTRFPVFFPEKRQFFLESANLFQLGSFDSYKPFFSRRIGLTPNGEPVPLDVGFRYVDQNSERSIGSLLIRQRDSENTPASWFGLARYQKNIGQNKRYGFMLTSRHDESGNISTASTNLVGNADTFIRFSPQFFLALNASVSYDKLDDKTGHAGDMWIAYFDNSQYYGLLQAVVSSGYRARAGFIQRNDVVITSPAISYNIRPSWRPSYIRAFNPGIVAFLFHNYSDMTFADGFVALRPLKIDFQNGSVVQYRYISEWQNLSRNFSPAGILIDVGNYQFFQHEFLVGSDQSARFASRFLVRTGGFFNGRLTTYDVESSIRPFSRASVKLNYIRNDFENLGADKESENVDLLILNLIYAISPRLQVTTFLQHNTEARTNFTNTRISWEFKPLSHLFLVLNNNQSFDNSFFDNRNGETQAIFKLNYLHQL